MDEISFGRCIFCANKKERRGLNMALYILSRILVDNFSLSEMFLFPSRFVGIFVKSLQFTYWML